MSIRRLTAPPAPTASGYLQYVAGSGYGWTTPSLPGSYNFSAASLPRFYAALARAMSGGNNLQICCAGDSVTAGNNADAPAKRYAQSYPYQLAQRLSVALPVRGTGWVSHQLFGGSPSYTGTMPAQDSAIGEDRIVATSSFTYLGPSGTPGGFFSIIGYLPSATTGSITIGPVNCDQIQIQTIRRTTANFGDPSGCPVTLDGVSQTALSTSAATADAYINTYSATQGSHTLVISNGPTASRYAFINMIKARSGGATGGVEIHRIAQGGQTASALAGTTGDVAAVQSINLLSGIGADLYIFMFSTNEGNSNVTPATFQTNLTTLVTAVRAVNADVLLMIDPTPSTASGWTYTPAQYIAAMKAVCDSQGVAMLDITARWPAGASSAPYNLFDGTAHPRSNGYSDIANMVHQGLRQYAGGI